MADNYISQSGNRAFKEVADVIATFRQETNNRFDASVLGSDYFDDFRQVINDLIAIKHGFPLDRAMTSVFQGANILQNPTMLKPNTNQAGYIFTTRPDLNLATENLKANRVMTPLLTTEANSIMRAIRMILSPRMAKRLAGEMQGAVKPRNVDATPLVDPSYPFIAVSDNTVKSLTGWPSSQLGILSGNAGLMKEVHIMADGPMTYTHEYSLNLSLDSMKGNATLYLYYFWILYIGFVVSQPYGMAPWPEYLFNGRLDYTTRIYRLIMDETRTYVEEMAATGYAVPRSVDIGPVFDYQQTAENPRPYADKTTEIEFACSGAIYLDEILIQQFNETVCYFNPLMRNENRLKSMVKVEKKYQPILNNKCYPRIDLTTRELEWWCPLSIVKSHARTLKAAAYFG